MDPSIKKIVDGIAFQYGQDKNVLGVMLFGSVARNKSDKYSDIDIYILLKKEGEYSRFNFVRNKNIRVDIIFNTAKDATTYLEGERFAIRRNISHMLAYGQIIFSRSADLEKIQRLAQKSLSLRTRYSKGEMLMHKYSIDDFWGEAQRDIEKRDVVAFGFDSQLLLNNIVELFLKLHGSFWRQPSDMPEVFKKLDKEFSEMITDFYSAKYLETKREVLARLVGYIYKKANGGLPKKWMLRN